MKRMIDETDQKILADIWQQLDDKLAANNNASWALTETERQMLEWLESYGRKLLDIEERKKRWQAKHNRDL